MRPWEYWLNTVILSAQHHPPRFVELVMLILAMILLGLWSVTWQWQYLTLSLSYIIGSSFSILVRGIYRAAASISVDSFDCIVVVNYQFL